VKSKRLRDANPFAYYGRYLQEEMSALWGRVVAAFGAPPRTRVIWANLDDRALTVLHMNEVRPEGELRYELTLPD
jgi:hypothetical protein